MLVVKSGAAAEEDPVGTTAIEDDAALVAAARAGDRDALGQLYERHGPMVHGLVLARAPHAETDDLVQEVFVQAMRKLGSLRDPAAFGPWLAAIARNRVADWHRSRVPVAPEDQAGATPSVAGAAVDAQVILGFIHELPLAYRETLILRLVEGMTGPEIAARTGLTAESVRVNLHRGMKKLRERLGGSEGEAP
jgi:RNA polymerase sigma-70 factor (ECF subfamily)